MSISASVVRRACKDEASGRFRNRNGAPTNREHTGSNPMRYMILVKATPDTEAGALPEQALIAEMATYHEELAKAGVLLDANGLQPTSQGFRIRYQGGKRAVVDGPFTATNELVAGYTVIQVKTRAEAVEWAKRFPAPTGEKEAEIEVRQLYELEDFGSDSMERFREMPSTTKK